MAEPDHEPISTGTAHAYIATVTVLLDSTLAECGRTGNSRAAYSDKHRQHRANTQVAADSAGRLLWISPALPGRAHGLTAAHTHRIIRICERQGIDEASVDGSGKILVKRDGTSTSWRRETLSPTRPRTANLVDLCQTAAQARVPTCQRPREPDSTRTGGRGRRNTVPPARHSATTQLIGSNRLCFICD